MHYQLAIIIITFTNSTLEGLHSYCKVQIKDNESQYYTCYCNGHDKNNVDFRAFLTVRRPKYTAETLLTLSTQHNRSVKMTLCVSSG